MNNTPPIFPIILAGGSGSRLWPKSRALCPKQFLALLGNTSLFQDTVSRAGGLSEVSSPLVITNEDHRFLVAEHLRQMNQTAQAIILEPVGRNTAPAIALAAFECLRLGKAQHDSDEIEDPILLVLAADHVIADQEKFQQAIGIARVAAKKNKLVTFGIKPTDAETGYGYIKAGLSDDFQAFTIDQFVEKPDQKTAEAYLASGHYYWNSGMFMFCASTYLQALETYRPDIFTACQQAFLKRSSDLDFTRPDAALFSNCPSESIDYAIMEQTDKAVMVALDAGWSDIGSWSALWAISEQDYYGNVVQGDVITHDTSGSYIASENKLIATVGVDDLIIVESDNAILVADKKRDQEVKTIVEQLKQTHRSESRLHRKVYRPWGSYDAIDMGERFQVKRLRVNPGAKLSLQKHYHRAEHWVVVKGTALVTNGDKEILLTENQSTYIPIGVLHRLENPGKVELEIIEVQSGSYFEEDDIVRIEDSYGRDK